MRLSMAVLTVLIGCATPALLASSKIGTRLAAELQEGNGTSPIAVWVTFTDKGPDALQKSAEPSALVSERSLQRRRNVMPEDALVDESDVPVEPAYLAAVRATGVTLRQQSRWFNAISVVAAPEHISRLALLPFVRNIELVAHYGRRKPEPASDTQPSRPSSPLKTEGLHSLDYGPSINQLLLMKVPAVHDMGNHAEGVIVGVFDNGVRLLSHEAFASMNILAQHDFVDHKTSVVPNNPALDFGDHGVNTLSTIGGYKPGQLIGPAYGASFILARTENDSSETPIEEDNWLAAIEWADSLGVQVTSTSLGYLTFDAPYTSWTWQDMNGRTTLISRAAAIAVRKGIVVLNSAGNEGYDPVHNTLDAPADADSVVAVGAVFLNGSRAGFSSVGPTTSVPPLIKPDVMAMGSGVYIASASNPTGYSPYGQGTSFACPLAAGVAALLVKAAPHASPMTIINAMKQTASQASAPDNLMGWGIVNAQAALGFLTGTDTGISSGVATTYLLDQNYPNPFNPGTKISFRIPASGPSRVRLTVYDVLGRLVTTVVDGTFASGYYQYPFSAGGLASGTYTCRLEVSDVNGSVLETRKMMLLK